MKAILLRKMTGVKNPKGAVGTHEFPSEPVLLAKYLLNGEPFEEWEYPKGTIVEDQDAYKLVHAGVAEPHDDECRAAVKITDEQKRVVQKLQEYQANGIQPRFRKAFDDGYVSVVKNGVPEPGPIGDFSDWQELQENPNGDDNGGDE